MGVLNKDFSSQTLTAGHANIHVPKNTKVCIVTYNDRQLTCLWEAGGNLMIPFPRSRIAVQQQLYWTDNNAAGRVATLRSGTLNATDHRGNNFTLTPQHLTQVERMSSGGGRYFVVKVVSGNDAGRKGIRIPIYQANLRRNGFPRQDWVHHRFTFDMDYTCRNADGEAVHTFKKGDSKACIRKLYDGGKILLVTTPNKENGRMLLQVDFWAGSRKDIREHDLADHTCRLLHDQRCLNTNKLLLSDTVGVIRSCKLDKNKIRIRDGAGDDFWVPMSAVVVGVPVGPYRVAYGTPNFGTSQAAYKSTGTNDVINDVVAGLLTGILAEGPNLPRSARHMETLYSTVAARRQQTEAFKEGLSTSTVDCMRQKRSLGSIQDLKALPDVSLSTKKGVYVRIYEGFAQTSPYYGKTYIYVGKTNNFQRRNREHKAKAGKGLKSRHYDIMNAASHVHYRVIWTQKAEIKKQRSLMEALFTMLLDSMDARITVFPELTREPGKLGAGTFDYWTNSRMAQILKHVADVVLKNTNFIYPSALSKNVEGINIRVPLDSGGEGTGEGRRWVRHALADRVVLTFGSTEFKTTKGSDCGISFKYANELMVYGVVKPDASNGLITGTKFWMNWEIMNPGSMHEAPYLRIPRIGFLNNWEVGNRIGLRITWRNPTTGKFFSKFEQTGGLTWNHYASDDNGSLTSHTQGASLYGFLTGSRWGATANDRPPFYPDLWTAEVLALSVDHFKQEITVEVDLSPVTILSAPRRSLEGAASQMRRLGLDNVNGPWRGFSPVDPAQDSAARKVLKTAENANSAILNKFLHKRQDCDRCFHNNLVSDGFDH